MPDVVPLRQHREDRRPAVDPHHAAARSSIGPSSWPSPTPPPSARRRVSPRRSSRRSPSTAASPTSPGWASTTTPPSDCSPSAARSSTTTCGWRIPRTIEAIGLELSLGTQIDGLHLRGIIDRLELRDGELVVTDYKTGRAPSANWELRSLSGVRFYALLCKQVFGRMPAAVRLLYLSSGEIIEATPSEQATTFVAARTAAVWKAVERACLTGDFKPHPTALCELCAFRPWCPAFGGDPERAAVEAPRGLRAHPGVNLAAAVERFDDWADDQLELIRGNPLADAVFTTASKLGEFSVIWHLTNVARGATGVGTVEQIPVFAALVGAESLLVNQGIKRLFRRTRPDRSPATTASRCAVRRRRRSRPVTPARRRSPPPC